MQELGYRATGRPRKLQSAESVLNESGGLFTSKRFNKSFDATLRENLLGNMNSPFKDRTRNTLRKNVVTYRGSKFTVAQLRDAWKIQGRWLMRRAGIVKQDEALAIYYADIRAFIDSEASK